MNTLMKPNNFRPTPQFIEKFELQLRNKVFLNRLAAKIMNKHPETVMKQEFNPNDYLNLSKISIFSVLKREKPQKSTVSIKDKLARILTKAAN